MKRWTPVLILAALAAFAGPLQAQSEYIWITRRAPASGGVTIFNAAGAGVVQLSGAGFGFDQPYGIVSAPKHKLVAVSNSGAVPGTVTLLNSETFQAVGLVTIATSSNLTEMSLSDDQDSVFIAGQDAAGPAVFRVDLPSGNSSRAGGFAASPTPATGVAVIRASNAGGSGSGPGKVYFSVSTLNQVFEINLLAGGATTQITLGSGAFAALSIPRTLARLPDHSAVFVPCTTNGLFFIDWIRINPALPINAATVVQMDATVQALTHNVFDAAFVNVLGTPRGFALINRDSSPTSLELIEVLVSGQKPAAAVARFVSTNQQGVNLHPGLNTAFMGAASDTDNNYYTSDIAGATPGLATAVADVAFNQNGATRFAFVAPPPAPSISNVFPQGVVVGGPPGSALVRIKGSGFSAATQVFRELAAARTSVATTFVDSSTLEFDASAFPSGALFDLGALNPDAQETTLNSYLQTMAPAPPSPPFSNTLPSTAQGYGLFSFPQYHTRAELTAAVTAQLGAYNPAYYRIWFWRGNDYVELNRATDNDLPDLSGRGFFVLTRFGQSLTLASPDTAQNTTGGTRVAILQPGWNIVSQPLLNGANRTTLYANVNVTSNPLLSGQTPASTSPALISTQPWDYVNRAYVRTDRMSAGRAYWVYNQTSSPLFLVFTLAQVTLLKDPGTSPGSPVVKPLAAASTEGPPPAAPSEDEASDGDSGGCGLLGVEVLLLLLFPALRRSRRLSA